MYSYQISELDGTYICIYVAMQFFSGHAQAITASIQK